MPEVALFQALCVWNVPDISNWTNRGIISLSIYFNTDDSTFRLIGMDDSQNFVINEYFSQELPQKLNDLFVTIIDGGGRIIGFNFLTADDATKFVNAATDAINKVIRKPDEVTAGYNSEASGVAQSTTSSSQSLPTDEILAKDIVSVVGSLTFREQMDAFAEEMKYYIDKKLSETQDQIIQQLHLQTQ
ncbi:uncharacterized protein MONOS_2597 [Monocercomonoides exilis]|uniref:uncharacterized protein n=1 Tax=Monocercomonoides exilis TaxID=2049356 RepID=UPI003559FA9D|nr:hypothetical protein MONOS_2597 [Monocercomonoides exilis]|eukprot:MONOS_2597.1-p1 / transcript=MONOS_2597.1 / gene=MONOS_2597 / organism=Monocercomonoides_exilis_PA203 / gene_product=unspecified product / transcript_product=unspecified product / location=Mono_scaffold00054:133209-133933(+) / protein_length=188 / sequence_SO=supercontig / SO=protein_coding / is_pseudo=false